MFGKGSSKRNALPVLYTYVVMVLPLPLPQPGSEHPRLTERLRALSESRAEVVQHTVKMDFISKVNK